MPFCKNCGKPLSDDTKFCPECGTQVARVQEPESEQRKQKYAGEIQKCPNCGEVVSAFEAICHSCGYELRNTRASNAVQALSDAIAKIEASRPSQSSTSAPKTSVKKGRTGSTVQEAQDMREMLASPTDRSIANVIQNFAIPNNKEDILEFFVLAANSLDAGALYHVVYYETPESVIARAWYSKYQQSYQKAKLAFANSPEFNTIQEIYREKQIELQKKKTRRTVLRILPFLFLILTIFFLFSWPLLLDMYMS